MISILFRFWSCSLFLLSIFRVLIISMLFDISCLRCLISIAAGSAHGFMLFDIYWSGSHRVNGVWYPILFRFWSCSLSIYRVLIISMLFYIYIVQVLIVIMVFVRMVLISPTVYIQYILVLFWTQPSVLGNIFQ